MRRRQNMKHPHLRYIVAAAVLAVAVIIAAVFFFRSKDNMAASAKKLPFYASSEYCYTGTGFLYVDGSQLDYYDLKDKSENYTLNLTSQDVSVAGHNRLHVIYSPNFLQIAGLQFPVEVSGTIVSVKCGEGFIAAHIRDGENDFLRIYDSTGSQVDEIAFDKVSLVDFGFYYSNRSCSLYSLGLDQRPSGPISTLSTYSLSPSALTGVLSVQNQLVSAVKFSDTSIFLYTTDNIIRYDASTNQESYRLLTYGSSLLDCTVTPKRPLFLTIPDSKNISEISFIKIYRASHTSVPEESMVPLQLPEGTVGAFTSGSRVYVVTRNGIRKYKYDASFVSFEELPFTPSAVYKLDDARALIASGEDMYIVDIKD